MPTGLTRPGPVSKFYTAPGYAVGTVPHFPELTRAPQVDVEETTDDPTLRDTMENGAVATRPRYTRAAGLRRKFKINYKLLTADDRGAVRDFRNAVGGWATFVYTDNRIAANPEELTVRFSKLPTIKDGKVAAGNKTFDIGFEIQEV